MGIGIGWGGCVDTDLAFSEFFGADHTVTVRFMLQYPHAFAGPILAENGTGTFRIGLGDFLSGPPQPKLELQVGSNRATYPADLRAAVWYHLAAVRSGNSYALYINGQKLNPAVKVSGVGMPSGALRLGRRTRGKLVSGREAQFFGLIDQAAVFGRALTAAEIEQISMAPLLTGAEPDLLAGWLFGVPVAGESLPPALARPVQLRGAARYVPVSANRSSEVDAHRLPVPATQAPMQLPFPLDQPWRVIQGIDDPQGSHKGHAAFCWDFMLAGKPQSATEGLPFLAAAPGKVVEVWQQAESGDDQASNHIMVEQGPGEICGYLHLQQNSARVKVGEQVTAGQELGAAGDTGAAQGACHLHLAVSTLPESQNSKLVTIPAAFGDYEVSADEGQTWRYVYRGVPQRGEWVRRIQAPLADFHGLRAERFQTAFDYWTRRGHWPVTLSTCLFNGQVLMAGSFQTGEQRPVRHLISAAAYEEEFARQRDRGYRPERVVILKTGMGLRFTAIWAPIDGPFESRWGMAPAEFHARRHLLRKQGYICVDLYAYQDLGVKFAATWVKRPFVDCATYFGMTAGEYQQRFDRFWKDGLRPMRFVAYAAAGDIYYAAAWESLPGGWIHLFGMTAEEYQARYNQYAAQGFRLHQIQAYSGRFSAIWHRP